MTIKAATISYSQYHQSGAWGLATHIDVYRCNPEKICDRDTIEAFTHQLCDLLEVRRFGDTQIVRFGDEPRVYGYSMVQLIETSLVSGHFAEETNAVYLDVFSCKYYDAAKAVKLVQWFFEGEQLEVRSCLRH